MADRKVCRCDDCGQIVPVSAIAVKEYVKGEKAYCRACANRIYRDACVGATLGQVSPGAYRTLLEFAAKIGRGKNADD